LSRADTNIQFESADAEVYAVDIERTGEENFQPTFKKLDQPQRKRLNEYILTLPPDAKVQAINARFCDLIGNMYPIADKEIKAYVNRILENMDTEQLHDCLERDFIYGAKIKQKITELARAQKEKVFTDYLDIDRVTIRPSYTLPTFITPSNNAPSITKSLYQYESSMNGFEQRVINDIANLDNVAFWHKIIERQGFRINGFINHYPDFLIKTKSNKNIIVESKGDDRDNSDSIRKLKLGQLWASKAGNNFRYIMVFDNNPIEGAHRLADAIQLISQI
jgi:type III restriction enzyme